MRPCLSFRAAPVRAWRNGPPGCWSSRRGAQPPKGRPLMPERRRIVVEGLVQGVGFRPFVYGLANQHRLGGHVRNDARGVTIEVEGEAAAIQAFVAAMLN